VNVERPKAFERFDLLNSLYWSADTFKNYKQQYKENLHNGTVHDDAILEQFNMISDAIKELMLMIDPTIFDGEERRCTS